MTPPYALVIATMNRPASLEAAFASLAVQIHPPTAVIVVDASNDQQTAELCQRWATRLPIRCEPAEVRSAARQRNQGAALVDTPLVGFMDDDVVLPPATMQKLAEPFADKRVGGVAGRILGLSHPVPHGLLWCYYRWQAGYSHPNYGGKVIGPGINLLPTFETENGPLIAAEWLNAGLVLYRRELFERERFPLFEGYSFLEDAHLSYRIGRTHKLFFRKDAPYEHNHQPSSAKSDRRALARMIVRHQRMMARDVLGLRSFSLLWKLTLHRLFQTIAVLRSKDQDRWQSVRGFWES
jgi:GT2 family glycosyltransferase